MNRYDSIPNELRSLNQWVCVREGSKVPMKSFERGAASSTDPGTWSSFDTALEAVSKGIYDYCGFVFSDNGIVGIDIDNGFDEDGFVSEVAAKIINRCKSYTEYSRSGRGFHVLLKGDIPIRGRSARAGVEIYKSARYFIMTGQTLLYDEINANQDAIDFVLETYFPEIARNEKGFEKIQPKFYSPIWDIPYEGNRIKLRPHYPKIPDGCRNMSLTSIAGGMHNTGYTKGQIYDELLYVNSVACEPPLEVSEIRNICSSVTKYKK